MTKVHEEPKRARGAELRRIPQGTPVYATAPAGRGRHRWAVWACKTHVERSLDLGWFESLLQRVEPIARGFAPTDEEAMRAALQAAPNAVQIARHHASAGALAWIDERAEMYQLGPKVAATVEHDDELRRIVIAALDSEPERAHQRLRDAYKARIGASYDFDWQGYICRYAIQLLVCSGAVTPQRRPRVVPSREWLAAVEAELAPVRAAVAAGAQEIATMRARPGYATPQLDDAGWARYLSWIASMAGLVRSEARRGELIEDVLVRLLAVHATPTGRRFAGQA